MTNLHLAGEGPNLVFHGDLSTELVDRIFEKDDRGVYSVVTRVDYDTLLNITEAWTRPATFEELRTSVFDSHGQRYLNPSGDAA